MDHLIIKYLTNQISLEERHQLSKWLEENELNARILEKFELYWNITQHDFSEKRTEVLNHIQSELALRKLDENQIIPETKSRSWHYLRYAAVLTLAVLSGIILHFSTTRENLQEVASISSIEKVCVAGQKITTTLPDGTLVKLNSDSKLIYPSEFTGDKREVVLFGEAFFDVIRNEDQPFIIKTSDMSIQVLGTSFCVKAFVDNTDQYVAVRTGKVNVISTSTQDTVQLIQNFMASLSQNHEFFIINGFDENIVFGWMDQKLVFTDYTSQEVFTAIERWFGVEVINPKQIESSKTYTATFVNPTIEEVMGSVSHIYQFDYIKEENNITISK